MPEKIKIKKNIAPYSYKRQGKTVKIKDAFKRGYWMIKLTNTERKALKEGKAKQLFEKKSERAKKMDRSKTSKTVYDKPNEEWVKAMNKSDVKGIDTKEKEKPVGRSQVAFTFNDFEIEEIQRREYESASGSQTLIYANIKNKITGVEIEDWVRPDQLRSGKKLSNLIDWEVKPKAKKEVKAKELPRKPIKETDKKKEIKRQVEFLENIISQFPKDEKKSQAQRNHEKVTYEELINVLYKEFDYARGEERVKIRQKINKRREDLKEKEIEDAENMFLEKANNDPKKADSLKRQYLYFSDEELEEWSSNDPLSKSALILKKAPQKPKAKPKPKLKPKPKYLLRSRPFGIGTVPKSKEIINRESHNPLKTGNYGWVQYPNKLTFEEIWKYELVPENKVEKANYMFWVKADKDSKQAKEWKDRYLKESLETLKEMSDRDPMCEWAYTIKEASQKQ